MIFVNQQSVKYQLFEFKVCFTFIGFAMIKLMNMFGWNHVTMIESDGGEYTAVAVAVRNALDNANFTIAGNIYVKQSDDTTTITRVLTSAKNTARSKLNTLHFGKILKIYSKAAYCQLQF